jgi:hypothetical protein
MRYSRRRNSQCKGSEAGEGLVHSGIMRRGQGGEILGRERG